MKLTLAEKNRYSRHLLLSEIGEQGQKKLKKAKILVIGAGGLGCPVLQYLTAAGVGKIGIVDFDQVEESNLQRQILYTVNDIGINKARAAQMKLAQLNPLVQIIAYDYELKATNALDLIRKYDLVIDGSDNFATRYLVNDACVITDKPLVYGAIFKFEGQVSVFNYQGGASYRCLFAEPPVEGEAPNCSEIGVLGVLPGIIGCVQANEALKIVLQIGEVLSNKLWVYNALNHESNCWGIRADKELIEATKKRQKNFATSDYKQICSSNIDDEIVEITAKCFLENCENYTLLDVRELYEEPRCQLLPSIDVPLPRVLIECSQIPKNKRVVVLCQKGIRSKIAIKMLRNERNYTNLINLKGGMSALEKELKN